MDGHPTASNAVVLQVTWNSTLRHTDMQSENILFLRLCTLLSWDYLNNSYTDGTPSGESAYVYTYTNLCVHFEFFNIIRPTGCCRFEAWSGKPHIDPLELFASANLVNGPFAARFQVSNILM